MNSIEPASGQTWVVSRDGTRPDTVEYVVLAVANHSTRMLEGVAERLVIYRAAYGQRTDPRRVWATPLDEFMRAFWHRENPRHPDGVGPSPADGGSGKGE